MKKISITLLAITALIFTGCQNNNTIENLSNNAESIFWNYEITNHYVEKMDKPDFAKMNNKDEIQQEMFQKPWELEYQISQEEINDLSYAKQNDYCENGEIGLLAQQSDYQNIVSIDIDKIKAGDSFKVQGNYKIYNFYMLPNSMIDQLKNHWIAFGAFPTEYLYPRYDNDYGLFSQEEWINRITHIGGSHDEYARAPFNTLLVTNDLLLHTFHKIFSNELQYFEESQARPILAKLSENLFELFRNKTAKTTAEQEIYDFLTAYRAIPHALLPDNDTLTKELNKRESEKREKMWSDDSNYSVESNSDFADETLRDYLNPRFEKIVAKVDSKYQSALKNTRNAIWEAKEPKATDYLLNQFSPDFIRDQSIQQDYTQFKPRSHYTNSSFLKTYFMGMKWLMREKLYFWDPKLANTALTMINQIPDKELKEVLQLQEAILQLIGSDDDASIQDLQTFIKKHWWKVGQNLDEKAYEELQNLGNQRIISTSYSTPEMGSTDEEAAKDMTRGFVFFWEKFTLDSYIFDLLTAWTAEKEYLEKPNMQTAMIVPDLLENQTPATQLVNLWLQNKSQEWLILENKDCQFGTCKHLSSYDNVKTQAKEKLKTELKDPKIMDTTYHKWLKMLGYLFAPIENVPYFKTLPQYIYKNILSYMGSYTELKHDTLLYVKQAYAELGGWGIEACIITVYPPALPVPKGYVEADINFINQLIWLNQNILKWFDDADNFKQFENYLQKIKSIALQQMNNKIISDEDFEWLRLSYDQLWELTYPRKIFWEASSKLERGALIADIFTSEGGNPLYEAVGRPLLMAVMIDDINGSRVVMWPIFSHYEFYSSDNILESEQRYTDELWQEKYDHLNEIENERAMWLEMKKMFEESK